MRHSLIIACLCLMPFTLRATQVMARPLSALVTESDHVFIGKVEKVQMVDEQGRELLDRKSRTGPGLKNELRLHVVIEKDGVLKTNAKKVPAKVVIPLWQMWHFSLGQWKDEAEGRVFIFLLKGEDFHPVYPAGFRRELSEKSSIERLLPKRTTGPRKGASRSSQDTNRTSSAPGSSR